MTDTQKQIEELISKAAKTTDSGDAMRFTQAACNAANAWAVLNDIKRRPAA